MSSAESETDGQSDKFVVLASFKPVLLDLPLVGKEQDTLLQSPCRYMYILMK